MRIALAGAGAFGEKHLDGLKNIDGVTVTSIVGRELDATQKVAEKYGVGHVTTDLDETLARDFTQDTFVRAFDRLKDFRADSSIATWLHAITSSASCACASVSATTTAIGWPT